MIDLAFTWQDIKQRSLENTVVMVADILRATTVMVTALTNGAKAILPQDSEAAARTLYAEMIAQNIPALICGEREGLKIPGFDLGNSPREFTPETVPGKTIIHLTTNGTRALNQVKTAQHIYIVSFLNRRAAAHVILPLLKNGLDILLVASGKESFFCLEDTICLGGVVDELFALNGKDEFIRHTAVTDAALAAQTLYQAHHACLAESIHTFSHARYLTECGLADDLPLCAQVDTSSLVPSLRDGKITV